MASALLALANPIYKGFQAETKFIENNPGIAGKPLSAKRFKSIGLGFKAFGEGFSGAGGVEAVAKAGKIPSRQSGGMIGGGLGLGSPMVLGHLPGIAHHREHLRGGSDARRPAYG